MSSLRGVATLASVRLAATTLLLILLTPVLHADRLELIHGDVITGTIVSMDQDRVVIETEYGTLSIDRSGILRGEFGRQSGPGSESLIFEFLLDGDLSDSTGVYRLTNNGMATVPDAGGNLLSALYSSGNGTYLSVTPAAELDALSDFTVSFSVRLDEIGGTRYLVSKWTRADGQSADGKFTLQTANGGLTLFLVAEDGSFSYFTAASVLAVGEWHHVAATYSGGRGAIYVDGALAAQQRFNFTELRNESAPILFMTAEARTADPFGHYNAVGAIDEIRMHNRALSADEIALMSGSDLP